LDVPFEIRHSVAFVAYRSKSGEEVIAGTCFFISRGGPELYTTIGYAITARHVIDSIVEAGHEPMLRLNLPDGATLVPLQHPWFTHDDPNVDIAVTMFPPNDGSEVGDHYALRWTMVDPVPVNARDPRDFFAGEDVFLVGCFYQHTGTKRNVPIIRLGSIAALDEQPVEKLVGSPRNPRTAYVDAYLIETRSQSGLSGSPVFVAETNRTNYRRLMTPETTDYTPLSHRPIYLLGLVAGHFDSKQATVEKPAGEQAQRLNVGITLVVPYYKLFEVFQQPEVHKAETDALAALRLESEADMDDESNPHGPRNSAQ
jgi:hypothetical protein